MKLFDVPGEASLLGLDSDLPPQQPFLDLLFEPEKVRLGTRVHSREEGEDSAALAKEKRLQFCEGVRPGHPLAEHPKGLAFLSIRPERLRADQRDRDDHDTEAEEQLSLEGHEILIASLFRWRQGKVGSRQGGC